MKKVCKECGELKEHYGRGLCGVCYSKYDYQKNREEILKYAKKYQKNHRKEKNEYMKNKFSSIPGCGGRRAKYTIWTNGVTEEIKPLIPIIKENVLKRAIKNPGRLLDEIEEEANK